ncbi:MAG: GTPase ObgE [Desulfobulbaceae bacterium]|uniref:GTPase ObgE n=1 Tax=Candidatus Desulfatifera sulfidica TaxID=2841691 RepID=A0A8J6NBV9_9BACT|nr:GTPase ObgE [Candidatus Desulfatifera sulfidica]
MRAIGSVIKDSESGRVLADLCDEGDTYVAARGGKGGMGNPHFSSSTNRTPRFATKGKLGDEHWLRIELKLIADIGLVGLPNAGKSTLLSQLSAANPKIAPYPFTTLEPQLGVLNFKHQEPCIIADIPGLVEGAHEGVGLGHTFLRHVERTRILLHVIDISSETVSEDFQIIENELRAYQADLVDRTQFLVLNKKDLLEPEELQKLEGYFADLGQQTLTISGLTGEGIHGVKAVLESTIDDLRHEDELAARASQESTQKTLETVLRKPEQD